MAKRALFAARRSVPFAFYRSGTSRGLFLLEQDLPPQGLERDRIVTQLMGSGHPQQLEGFGGGNGPTSKAVVVGSHPDRSSVTYTFMQCSVLEGKVDHSHGDCGNMIGAVGPFALEAGLVPIAPDEPRTNVKIHSLSTGSLYAADVLTEVSEDGHRRVQYDGSVSSAGLEKTAAPVVITTHGIAGCQTGKLLPTGNAEDRFEVPELAHCASTIVDFARALIILDAREVLPHFGYSSVDDGISLASLGKDAKLNDSLNRYRLQAALAMGMGDCAGKDSPKVALVAPPASNSDEADLLCWYWVNPERSELHPTIAMTAAQALGAACFLPGGIVYPMLRECRRPGNGGSAGSNASTLTLKIRHAGGIFPVDVNACVAEDGPFAKVGLPTSASYSLTVRPIAHGEALL